jgi:hypothetical protein
MVGFFNLNSGSLAEQRKTGEAIMRLSRSVFDESPGSEWAAFNEDPRKWLYAAGYRYDGPGAGKSGRIPASVTIVPVYDSPNIMHVRIPSKGLFDNPPAVQDEPTYGGDPAKRFPVLLARYFMRHCR